MKATGMAALLLFVVAGASSLARTPWGPPSGDDHGFIPSTPTMAKCQNALAKAAGKAVTCFLKCHALRALGTIADENGEETCEGACTQKFTKVTTKIGNSGNCGCADFAGTVRDAEAFVDKTIGDDVYCAPLSPSGAFLDFHGD